MYLLHWSVTVVAISLCISQVTAVTTFYADGYLLSVANKNTPVKCRCHGNYTYLSNRHVTVWAEGLQNSSSNSSVGLVEVTGIVANKFSSNVLCKIRGLIACQHPASAPYSRNTSSTKMSPICL